MTLSGSPLIDLHRHLDGSVRVQTMIDLANQHNLELPAWTVEELRPIVQVTSPQPGILAFFEKFKWQTLGMVDDAAIRRIAYENVEDAALAGLDYVELRFSPLFMAQAHQLDPVMSVRTAWSLSTFMTVPSACSASMGRISPAKKPLGLSLCGPLV